MFLSVSQVNLIIRSTSYYIALRKYINNASSVYREDYDCVCKVIWKESASRNLKKKTC